MTTMAAIELPVEGLADETAATFDECFRELFGIAYKVAFRLLGHADDSADVASEATGRAWQRWAKVEQYARPWVAAVAANLAIATLRRQRIRGILGPAARPDITFAEDRRDLVRALRRLPGRQREVVVLRFMADLSEAQVADALGCSVGSVKQHAARAISALRSDSTITRTP